MTAPFDLSWSPVEWNLAAPLSWPTPARVNVEDLFRKTSNEEIAAVFGVMAAAPQHTFFLTTERPKRMHAAVSRLTSRGEGYTETFCAVQAAKVIGRVMKVGQAWPLPNVHLGVRVTDQRTADARIPALLDTPTAVRFVEVVPVGPVDLEGFLYLPTRCNDCGSRSSVYDTNPNDLPTLGTCLLGVPMTGEPGAVRCGACQSLNVDEQRPLDWVLVSGESGPAAQPCDMAWIRSIIGQCRAAAVPVFVRQLGSLVYETGFDFVGDGVSGAATTTDLLKLTDPNGADPAEWPEDLRVRELPR